MIMTFLPWFLQCMVATHRSQRKHFLNEYKVYFTYIDINSRGIMSTQGTLQSSVTVIFDEIHVALKIINRHSLPQNV